jgi:HPt (histidine-containing phosphotransfer) domain-containing protein
MENFIIEVDNELEEIVPNFLKNREKDLIELKNLLASDDIEGIEKIGHKVAGSSGGYGFHELGKICKELELKAMDKDSAPLGGLIQQYEDYITHLEVKYVEMDD